MFVLVDKKEFHKQNCFVKQNYTFVTPNVLYTDINLQQMKAGILLATFSTFLLNFVKLRF